jgi:hypothetical protein
MNKLKRKQVDDVKKKDLYMMHDNYNNPFAIQLIGKQVYIYEVDTKDKKENFFLIGKVPIRNKNDVMIGIDNNHKFHGNSVIIKLKNNKYIFIGYAIYEFQTTDNILNFYSPIGNSDVPYPYAVGEKFTYLMIEGVCIDNRYLKSFISSDKNSLPYSYYYGFDVGKYRTDGIKKFKIKYIIHRRENMPDFITPLHI